MKTRKLIPLVLAVIIIGFTYWWVSGLHFGHKPGDFDPRADEFSEGQCP